MFRSLFVLFVMSISILAQFQGPKLFSPATKFDFGAIEQGAIVKHKFVIVNNGDQMLNIDKVVSSCGCTVAEPEKKELKPSETTTIAVEFNSTGRLGDQVKTISILSNDPVNPLFQLTISGKVMEAPKKELSGAKIKFEKSQHDFGIIKEGIVIDHVFKFTNIGKSDLEIRDIRTSCGCTAASPSKKVFKPGESGELKVSFDSKNRSGRTSRTITLITNDEVEEYYTLTIYAEITN
ncbi:MAG: DUF1573 domain-containing protein [Ignavibacteriales bacterium]|nr:DUF1573 domain-containing protein [Ignavibacteriales bacterium]